MVKPKKQGQEQLWAEAQRRCRLSDEAVGMAKELGLNPRSLIKNIPSPREQWKAPVEEWLRDIYQRRHSTKPRASQGTRRPDDGSSASGQPQASGASRPMAQTDREK
jgi:hypothetical protein